MFGTIAKPVYVPVDDSTGYICKSCGKRFLKQTTFNQHSKLHTKSPTCGECGVLFFTKKRFLNHLCNKQIVGKGILNEGDPYSCISELRFQLKKRGEDTTKIRNLEFDTIQLKAAITDIAEELGVTEQHTTRQFTLLIDKQIAKEDITEITNKTETSIIIKDNSDCQELLLFGETNKQVFEARLEIEQILKRMEYEELENKVEDIEKTVNVEKKNKTPVMISKKSRQDIIKELTKAYEEKLTKLDDYQLMSKLQNLRL